MKFFWMSLLWPSFTWAMAPTHMRLETNRGHVVIGLLGSAAAIEFIQLHAEGKSPWKDPESGEPVMQKKLFSQMTFDPLMKIWSTSQSSGVPGFVKLAASLKSPQQKFPKWGVGLHVDQSLRVAIPHFFVSQHAYAPFQDRFPLIGVVTQGHSLFGVTSRPIQVQDIVFERN